MNFGHEPNILRMYARHYNTATLIYPELIDKLKKSRQFNQGFETVEYLASAILDMKYHMLVNPENLDINEFENKALTDLHLISSIAPQYRSTYFSDIFSGEESAAGYYNYIWSEMLCKDAFEAFVENRNIIDATTAKSFRENILEKGNSDDLQRMYKNFRGRKPVYLH